MHTFDFSTYRSKVYGCFVGKCVGGTLGMKYEGTRDYHPVTYYDPVPSEMIPNDDLDLQVVNLETILRTGLPICRYHLGETWKNHIADHAPDEYAVAVSNYALKLSAPLSGIYRNKFYAGMGSAIRSELWACLAPASPALAAAFAKEDACTDHCSDGVYAEMLLAAMESAAFVERDLLALIDVGMQYVPDGHRLKNAFTDVIAWWNESHDILHVRELILEHYHADNWTDVTINLSFIILSLLSCEGSFDRAICTAASLGYDADCTCATVGSIFGIMDPDGIDEKWTAPIGERLVLSPGIVNMHEPASINEFCDTVIAVAHAVQDYYATGISIPQIDFQIALPPAWTSKPMPLYEWQERAKEALLVVKPLAVTLEYPDTVAAIPGKENAYALRLTNLSSAPMTGEASFSLPQGFCLTCGQSRFSVAPGESVRMPFVVTVGELKRRTPRNPLTITLTINGVSFDVEANMPVSSPWRVEDLESGETQLFEADNIFFEVPAGAYKYTATFIAPAPKEVRISAGGTRPFTVFLNGKEVKKNTNEPYVPAFHRDANRFTTSVLQGKNQVEIVFEKAAAGEIFFGFSTTIGCATWIDTMEWTL